MNVAGLGLDAVVAGVVDQVAAEVCARVVAELEQRESAHAAEPWRLWDVVELGERLGRSRRWVHEAVKTRGLPHVRLDGGALAFDPDAVREWARARQVPAVEPLALAPRLQAGRQPASVLGSGRGSR